MPTPDRRCVTRKSIYHDEFSSRTRVARPDVRRSHRIPVWGVRGDGVARGTLPSFADLDPGPWLLVVAAGGGLVVSLLAKWSPLIRGLGIPEAMEAVLERQSRISPRAAVAKP